VVLEPRLSLKNAFPFITKFKVTALTFALQPRNVGGDSEVADSHSVTSRIVKVGHDDLSIKFHGSGNSRDLRCVLSMSEWSQIIGEPIASAALATVIDEGTFRGNLSSLTSVVV
jgi:hypothetical protein